MAKSCQVCEHPKKSAIEEALGRGEPYQMLTKQLKVSIGAMRRHRKGHMSKERIEAPLEELAFVDGEDEQAPEEDTSDFPESLTTLLKIGELGGSTGAELLEDEVGRRFVAKKGAGLEQLLEEVAANTLYRAAGVPVPRQKLYEGPEGLVRLSEYVEGRPLNGLGGSKRRSVTEKAREHFALDALLANWDVVGNLEDNLLLTSEGEVYRIDNGGALRMRARGERKTPDEFCSVVRELWSMRDEDNPSGEVFCELSDEDVCGQVHKLLCKRGRLLAAAPADLRGVLGRRLDYMEEWTRNHAGVKRVYLRLGGAPKSGTSYSLAAGGYEEGVSVFSGYETQNGYAIDVPFRRESLRLLGSLIFRILGGRAVYIAEGEVIGEGEDGEPLLSEDVTLRPVPPYTRVELPAWLPLSGQKFADAWNKWRRTQGRRGAQGSRKAVSLDLGMQAAHAIGDAQVLLEPASLDEFDGDREELYRHWRRKMRKGRG